MPENTDFIGVDVMTVKELQAKLAKLGPEGQSLVVDDISKFLIDVFRQYPPEKRVTRTQAYGMPFFTDKQRRYFFAALNAGVLSVPYKRTQHFRKMWKQIGKGKDSIIVNETPHAKFLMGDGEQSRHAFLIGWNTINKTIEEHNERMIEKADGAIKRAIKKVGLK